VFHLKINLVSARFDLNDTCRDNFSFSNTIGKRREIICFSYPEEDDELLKFSDKRNRLNEILF
jgi:hypothetical protein